MIVILLHVLFVLVPLSLVVICKSSGASRSDPATAREFITANVDLDTRNDSQPTVLDNRVTNCFTLPSGLMVATESWKNKGVSYLRVEVNAGVRYETAETNGVAHFLERVIVRSARSRSKHGPKFVDDRILSVIGKESISFDFRCTSVLEVQQGLSVLSEAIVKPSFTAADIEAERTMLINQCNEFSKRMDFMSGTTAVRDVYGPHPIALNFQGSVEFIKKCKNSDLRKFYDEHFKANRIFVVAVGEVDHEEVVELTKRYFKAMPNADLPVLIPARWMKSTINLQTGKYDKVYGALAVEAFASTEMDTVDNLVFKILTHFSQPKLEDGTFAFFHNLYSDTGMFGIHFSGNNVQSLIDGAIQRFRYVAYELTQDRFDQEKMLLPEFYTNSDGLYRLCNSFCHHLRGTGQIECTKDLWKRTGALTLSEFREIARQHLLVPQIELVIYGPPGTILPSKEELVKKLCAPYP